MSEQVDQILKFWFGRVEDTIVPSENRARIWFGEDTEIDTEIKQKFEHDLFNSIAGNNDHWTETPRGQLASIILLDQFSRHIFRDNIRAYQQDDIALMICANGIQEEAEHSLSLIERVFYYFPLLHSEQLGYQEQSVRAYQMLTDLAFAETRVIYDSFLKFANHHYSIILRFGRFPQRNALLGRVSTPDEIAFLKEIEKAL